MGRRPVRGGGDVPDYRVWEDPDPGSSIFEPGPSTGDVSQRYTPALPPFCGVLDNWVRPRRGDLISALERGPFLDEGRLYVCTDVRESRGGWDRTNLLRVEFASPRSPSGKIFGPPVDRFVVGLRHVPLPGAGRAA